MATKKFTDYISENKHEYKYTIKLAITDMQDHYMDCLETALQKYQLKSASAFRKTPIQESPLDFPNVKNMPVFMSDIVLGYPASLDFLRTFVGNVTGISTQQIAVYSENDPRQIETDLYLQRTSDQFKDQYQTALGNDYPATEKPPYGDQYNISFLKELETVRKNRECVTVENPLSPAQTIDHSTLPKGYSDTKQPSAEDVGFFGRNKRVINK